METPIYHLEGVVKSKEEDREDFVGPLDLILHLLSKNKMEIRDIQISLILDQYLAWMQKRKEMDLEVASEFVTMASQLIFIKTRMLLSIQDEEALSEMEQLIATLEAHQRSENYLKIKAMVPELDRRYRYGRDLMVKQPEPLQAERGYRYVHEPDDIRRAMQAVLARVNNKLPPPVSARAMTQPPARVSRIPSQPRPLTRCPSSAMPSNATKKTSVLVSTVEEAMLVRWMEAK